MRYTLLFISFALTMSCFAQIVDHHVIPFPRDASNTKLIIKCEWGNYITHADSSIITLDSNGYNLKVIGYYTNTTWPACNTSIDTFDLSNYVEELHGYYIQFISCVKHYFLDTILGYDTIWQRIAFWPTSGFESLTNKNQIKIYPNPTSGKVNIVGNEIYEVELLNNNGQLMERYSVNNDRFILNLNNRSMGVYYIRVNGGEAVEKIIVN